MVHGRVVEVPLAGDKHGRISGKIFLRLGTFVEDNELGLVYGGDTNFVISEAATIVRAPDVSFVSTARQQPVTNGAVPLPPDLAVEVMSRHDYDHPTLFAEKIAQYQAADVPLIWVVKPREKEVAIYHVASATRLPCCARPPNSMAKALCHNFVSRLRIFSRAWTRRSQSVSRRRVAAPHPPVAADVSALAGSRAARSDPAPTTRSFAPPPTSR